MQYWLQLPRFAIHNAAILDRVAAAMLIFTVCQIGSEASLRREVARARPQWRLAFSRPGFVTFKTEDLNHRQALDQDWQPVFARRIGVLFDAPPRGGLPTPHARSTVQLLAHEAPGQPLRLHVFPMGQPHDRSFLCPRCRAVHDELAARAFDGGVHILSEPDPKLGDLVADIAVSDGSDWAVGLHRHYQGVAPWPGGNFPFSMPPDAPSDAWLKAEEGIRRSGLPLERSQTVLKIGCAPGGGSMALLQRGLDVIGVDPVAVDQRVAGFQQGYARFTWLPRRIQDLAPNDLNRHVHWMMIDVNAGAGALLPYVQRLISLTRPSLLGLLWIVKLNNPNAEGQLPDLIEQVRATGLEEVRCAQLSTNNNEVLITARMRPRRR